MPKTGKRVGAFFVPLFVVLLVACGQSTNAPDTNSQKVGAHKDTSLPTSSAVQLTSTVGMPIPPGTDMPPVTATLYENAEPVTSTVIYRGTPVVVINRRYILEGKTPEQIGDYVVQKLAPGYLSPIGPVQVRLARSITREEVPQLGLGCLVANMGTEEPPYVLVILQGEFGPLNVPGRMQLAQEHRKGFAAFIIDVWAAAPTTIWGSLDAARYGRIFNAPTLPEATSEPQVNCPPRVPGNYPHGSVGPGVVLPTSPPLPTDTLEPIPPPVGTIAP